MEKRVHGFNVVEAFGVVSLLLRGLPDVAGSIGKGEKEDGRDDFNRTECRLGNCLKS